MSKLEEIKSEIVKKIHDLEAQQDKLKSLIGDFLFEFEIKKQNEKKAIQDIAMLSRKLIDHA